MLETLSLPPNWRVLPMRRVIDGIEQGWSPIGEDRPAHESEWAVIKLNAIKSGHFLDAEYKALPPETEPVPKLEIRIGDLLLTRANTPELVGDVCLVRQSRPRLMLCDLVYRLRPARHVDAAFLMYWLLGDIGRGQIRADARGSSQSMAKVSQAHVRDWSVALPPPEEQRRIADFLDRKTAVIDELIAKKERLVELLAEKRQALITQAVTKGLDPNAPMKESGVEWIGRVPAHWEVVRFRRISRLQQGLQIPREDRHAEPGPSREEYITIQSLHAGSEFGGREYIERPPRRAVCRHDDVLMARTGATGEVVTGASGAFHNNFFKVDWNRRRLTKDYLVAYLSCTSVTAHLLEAAGTTTIPDLNHDEFLDTPALVPPMVEQERISRFLFGRTGQGRLEIAAAESIRRLREYRQSLITAAVTGKLDVSFLAEPTK